ncbi:MAG: Uma2 family endonuclease [Anaerolineae bacterium]|nr:Uma2 family endonuclease [Anaerolineae bacterium]
MLNVQPVTKEQFYEFALRPENRDRNFEYIAGEIVEVVSNSKSSTDGLSLTSEVRVYVKRNKLGRCTGADGGYSVSGEDYIPDGAFMSYARQPVQPSVAYNPLAPDLAIEMLSPGNTKDEMTHKIGNYMAADTVVWVGNPETKIIDVYVPGQPVKRLRVGDVLEGGDVLPGFRLAIADIFED